MEKEFKAWIILNWKTGTIRVLKNTKYSNVKKKITPSEILVDFNLKVKIPESPAVKAHGEIELPEAKVKEILIDSFEENND